MANVDEGYVSFKSRFDLNIILGEKSGAGDPVHIIILGAAIQNCQTVLSASAAGTPPAVMEQYSFIARDVRTSVLSATGKTTVAAPQDNTTTTPATDTNESSDGSLEEDTALGKPTDQFEVDAEEERLKREKEAEEKRKVDEAVREAEDMKEDQEAEKEKQEEETQHEEPQTYHEGEMTGSYKLEALVNSGNAIKISDNVYGLIVSSPNAINENKLKEQALKVAEATRLTFSDKDDYKKCGIEEGTIVEVDWEKKTATVHIEKK